MRPQARGQAAANGLLDSTSPTPYGSRTAGTSYRRWQVSRPRCAPNRCAISGSQMALRGGKPTPDLACSRETSPPRKNQPGAADETPASGVGGAERPGPGHQTAFDPHHTDLFNQNANHLVSDKLWAPFKPAGQPLYRIGVSEGTRTPDTQDHNRGCALTDGSIEAVRAGHGASCGYDRRVSARLGACDRSHSCSQDRTP